MKISKAQARLLSELVAAGSYACAQTYPPAVVLVREGYATGTTGRFGSYTLHPTEKAYSVFSD